VVGSKAEKLKPGPERRPSGWEPSGAKITCERNIPQATRNSKGGRDRSQAQLRDWASMYFLVSGCIPASSLQGH